MSEGDYTPRAGRPKPLTQAQLRKRQKEFAKVDEILEKIKELEKKHPDEDIEEPKWI